MNCVIEGHLTGIHSGSKKARRSKLLVFHFARVFGNAKSLVNLITK